MEVAEDLISRYATLYYFKYPVSNKKNYQIYKKSKSMSHTREKMQSLETVSEIAQMLNLLLDFKLAIKNIFMN